MAIGAATQSVAQDGGKTLTFGLSTTARYEDNWLLRNDSPPKSAQVLSNLTFGFSSETHTQALKLDGGLSLHATQINGGDPAYGGSDSSGVIDPFLSASYRLEGPSTTVHADAAVSNRDRTIDRGTNFGTLKHSDAALGILFGQDLRFGGNLDLNYSRNIYRDTIDNSDRTAGANAGLRFDLNPALSLTTGARFTRYNVEPTNLLDPKTQTDTTVASVGLIARPSPVDTITVNVSHSRIDENIREPIDGVTGSVTYEHAGRVATTSVTLATDISYQGRQTSLDLSRKHDLTEGRLGYGIGVSRDDAGNNDVTAHLDWGQTFRASTIDISYSRGVATADSGNLTLTDNLNAKYVRELSDVARLNAVADYTGSDERTGTRTRDGSVQLSLGYSVNDNWQLSSGLERRFSTDDANVTAYSNSIFVTLERTWVAVH